MTPNSFSKPQRQSKVGVLLIFLTTIYKIVREFWAVGAYLLFTTSGKKVGYLGMGLLLLVVLALVYSYIYYQRFVFHIDYEKAVFVLKKGVFSSEDTEIPFDKIQQVDIQQSILQRFINVHSLVIDTAGGKEKEVTIKAISKSDANQLSSILMREKGSRPEGHELNPDVPEETAERKEKILWRYTMKVSTLLKIGISSNYLRGLVLIAAFFATIYQELSRWSKEYSGTFDTYMSNLPDPTETIPGLLLVVVLVLLGSILITVIEVFVKYFNLKLQGTSTSLQLEMGLKNNKRITLQPRRVQLLRTSTNPVQKKLDLYEMKISLASSENSFGKSKIKIPGLGRTLVSKVNDFLYTKEKPGFGKTFKPHIVLFFRKLTGSVIPISAIFYILFLLFGLNFLWMFVLACIFSSGMGIYQFFLFKSLRLHISEEFIVKKHGFWNRVEGRLETFKIQAVTIKEPYFYQKRDLVNIVFHTAGGDVSFSAVHRNILPFINFALYKIESSDKNWM